MSDSRSVRPSAQRFQDQTIGRREGETLDDYCERLKAECRAKIAARKVPRGPAPEYWYNKGDME